MIFLVFLGLGSLGFKSSSNSFKKFVNSSTSSEQSTFNMSSASDTCLLACSFLFSLEAVVSVSVSDSVAVTSSSTSISSYSLSDSELLSESRWRLNLFVFDGESLAGAAGCLEANGLTTFFSGFSSSSTGTMDNRLARTG